MRSHLQTRKAEQTLNQRFVNLLSEMRKRRLNDCVDLFVLKHVKQREIEIGRERWLKQLPP